MTQYNHVEGFERVLKAFTEAVDNGTLNDAPIMGMLCRMPDFKGGPKPPTKWLDNVGGVKPSRALLHMANAFTKSGHGGAECMFRANMMRPGGCSLAQLAYATSNHPNGGAGPAHNVNRPLAMPENGKPGLGYFNRATKPQFTFTLTEKGEKYLISWLAGRVAMAQPTVQPKVPAKPVAKPAGKVSKPKATPIAPQPETQLSEPDKPAEAVEVSTVENQLVETLNIPDEHAIPAPSNGLVDPDFDAAGEHEAVDIEAAKAELAAHFNN